MTMLVPALVRTFGRTGSTLLMQILGTDRRVRFEREYPFEHRYLTYAYNLARVVGEPCRGGEEWNNDKLFHGNTATVGGLPYGETPSLDREALARDLFVSNWERISEHLRRSGKLSATETAWYAEKVPRQVAHLSTALLGGRSIWLLRDPRDEMVSIKSFNARRGFHSFGWQESDTDATYARRLCKNRRAFLERMIKMGTTHEEIGVRYEDLVLDGPKEVRRLSEWLGASLDLKAATNDKRIKKVHMTSGDAASSVERWRRELGDDVQAIFRDEIGDELGHLGYAA